MEHVDRVRLPDNEGERVQIHITFRCGMHAAEIKDELAIDEHPDVIIACELELFSAVVNEWNVNFRGEEEVVHCPLRVGGSIVPALSVEWKETLLAA